MSNVIAETSMRNDTTALECYMYRWEKGQRNTKVYRGAIVILEMTGQNSQHAGTHHV